MKVRWLGWAGIEIEADGASVVIDPLEDPGATFAALGDGARDVQLPPVVAAEARRTAVGGMVSHLHRDHADSGALAAAMAPGATVHEPAWPGGDEAENLALAQANAELERSGLARRQVEQWETADAGPFAITPLPAVDGLGDPQVSWLVEAGGRRVLHLGDTIFHGYWWRMARRHGPFDLVFVPINGAVIDFPHLQPPSVLAAAMEPDNPGVHQTATVDYGVVLDGEVHLELDDGVKIRLTAGDTIVQLGSRHAWRNPTDRPATVAFVLTSVTA